MKDFGQPIVVIDDTGMVPVFGEESEISRSGKPIIQQKHYSAVVLSADNPASCLEHLVHTGVAVGKIVALIVFLLVVIPQYFLFRSDFGKSRSNNRGAEQFFPL